jgi:hypothetical protein
MAITFDRALSLQGVSFDDLVGLFGGAGLPSAEDDGTWPLGSLYIQAGGSVFKKTANPATYVELGAGGGGVAPTTATITQAGHGLSLLNVIRSDAGVWSKALANLDSTLGLGVVTGVTDVNTFEVSMSGRFLLAAHGLTVDEYYFLSDTTAGAMTATEPTISQPVLYVENANYVWLLPYRPATAYDPTIHAIVWRDLFAPLSTAKATGGTVPTWSSLGTSGIYGYLFSASQLNELQVSFHIDHDFYPGSTIYPHVHWAPTTAAAGTVRWIMQIVFAKGHSQQAFNFNSPIELAIEQATTSTAWTHHVAEAELTALAATMEPDSIMIIRFYRDAAHANDTYPDAVYGQQVDIHYQADRVGTPGKAPNFYV